MPRIIVRRIGVVSEDTVRNILDTVEECYQRSAPHAVELLELLLFESSVEMTAFYAEESEAYGVASQSLGEEFLAAHDAWTGTSRIGVCIERMNGLPRLVGVGALRHEVGHSILHGSLEHYVFPITPPLLRASKRFSLMKANLFAILYLISIVVKDFEATKLLAGKGYLEDQAAYSLHVLKASPEDLGAWRMAKGNPTAMALCAAGRLKDAACTMTIGQVLTERPIDVVARELSYLNHPMASRLAGVLEAFPKALTRDTFSNVNSAVRLFVERLLEPTLSEGTWRS